MGNSGILNEKQQQANEFIRGQLFRLQAGDPLPSLRKLMTQSGLGRVMLENAIHYWQSQELLISKPRQGYFRTVRDNHYHHRGIINIIACGCVNYLNVEAYQNHLIQKLFQIGSDNGLNMLVHVIKFGANILEYSNLVQQREICNCFLISPENREIVNLIKGMGVNTVVVAPFYDLREGPAVIDNPQLMDMQMDYLIQRRHRKIAYLYCDGESFSSQPHSERREHYYRRMALAGFKLDPDWVFPVWGSEFKIRRKLEVMLNSRNRPTAIICHEFYLPLIYAVLTEKHLVVGRDIAIMSDGESSRLRPLPTMVHNSPLDMAQQAWDLMQNLLAGKADSRILQPEIFLAEGRSTFPLPADGEGGETA